MIVPLNHCLMTIIAQSVFCNYCLEFHHFRFFALAVRYPLPLQMDSNAPLPMATLHSDTSLEEGK